MAATPTYEELAQQLKACSAALEKAKQNIAVEARKRRKLERSLDTFRHAFEDKVEQKVRNLKEEKEKIEAQLEERIMMTDALYENEQQFRTLVANMPGAVYRFNIDAEWNIGYISDKIEEITKYPVSHFKLSPVRKYRDIIHKDDQSKVEAAIHGGMDPMDSFSVEYRIIDKYGKIHWLVETGQAVYSPDGKPLWLDGTIFDITDRKDAEAELAATQKKLIEKAHQAGMADIAADTLHNVGNILNSIKTSSQILSDICVASVFTDFKKANQILRENIEHIDEFISSDPKGRKLMQYYLELEDAFKKEYDFMNTHYKRLAEKVYDIEAVIKAQQSYTVTRPLNESLDLIPIVEDALVIQSEDIACHQISVIKNFQPVPKVNVQKNKLLYILVNLIQNAENAMLEIPAAKRSLLISIAHNDASVFIRMQDTGPGIPEENIKKIFFHGFSTKNEHKGFGLHSSANYMIEMNGKIWAESDGNGATFVLQFPLSDA